MLCRLCNIDKDKLCKAHLIPEAFFRFLYDEGDAGGDALKMVSHDVDYVRKSRTGIYDDTILCPSCDAMLGTLDHYGKEVLLDQTPRFLHGDISIFDGININKFALFALSVLWRCSISKRDEARQVSLGSKFENQIRGLLINNADVTQHFPTIISQLTFIHSSYKKIINMPFRRKFEGVNYYYVNFPNGYKVLIKVDSRPQLQILEGLTLSNGQPAYVVHTSNFENTDEYAKVSNKLRTIHNL